MASNDNSSSKFTKFDRNRFRKIYPVNRFRPSESFRSQTAINIESLSIPFGGLNTASGTLNNFYNSIPVIMVAPKVPVEKVSGQDLLIANDQANVNLFISSLTLDAGRVSFTIEASAGFSGEAVVTVVSLT